MNAIKFLLYVGDGGMSFPGNLTNTDYLHLFVAKDDKISEREIVATRPGVSQSVNKVQSEIRERERERERGLTDCSPAVKCNG